MDFSNTPIIKLATILAAHLKERGIDVVLVGGLAVEIYTDNLYLTKDIDLVNTNYRKPKTLHEAMAELGFHKRGRIYINSTTDITVEFPSGPLSVGNSLVTNTTLLSLPQGEIPILHIDDGERPYRRLSVLARSPITGSGRGTHVATSVAAGGFQNLLSAGR